MAVVLHTYFADPRDIISLVNAWNSISSLEDSWMFVMTAAVVVHKVFVDVVFYM